PWKRQRLRRTAADIAERRELLLVLVADRRRRSDGRVRDQAVERRAHGLSDLRPLLGHRRGLAGVLLLVEQLVARRADEAVTRVRERIELAPAEVITRVESLGVDARIRQRAGPVEERLERAPL